MRAEWTRGQAWVEVWPGCAPSRSGGARPCIWCSNPVAAMCRPSSTKSKVRKVPERVTARLLRAPYDARRATKRPPRCDPGGGQVACSVQRGAWPDDVTPVEEQHADNQPAAGRSAATQS